MRKIPLVIIVLATFIFSGCSMIEDRLEPTIQSRIENTIASFTQVPTQTPYDTLTPYATYTVYPTLTPPPTYTPRIIIVTATATHTPIYTATITPTFTQTPTQTATIDSTKTDKGPGFYLIGEDIAPGVWRSLGDSDSCYWAVTTKTGDIISNHFGMAGGTMYVPSSGYQVELDSDCGRWTFLGE